MLLGVDFLTFEYAGISFPGSDLYETVCKWYAKSKNFKDVAGSSGTNTSSSSEEER